MLPVLKKELKNYFGSPYGYIFIGLFILIISLNFFNVTNNYLSVSYEMIFFDTTWILAILVPILTMKLFTEERKTGTEQLLLSSPRSRFGIVIGKFLSAVIVALITISICFIYHIILSQFGNPDIGLTFSVLIGLFLTVVTLISIGMFISVLSPNQSTAIIITIPLFLVLYFVASNFDIVKAFSPFSALDEFLTSAFPIARVLQLLLTTVVFVLLTHFVYKRRTVTR